MLDAARKAFAQIWTPPFRAVLLKSVGLTLLMLLAAWLGLEYLLTQYVRLPYAWMDTALAIVFGLGLFVGMIFLVPPVSAFVAGFFLDEIAAEVERQHYP
jgi:CysZ protein